ncbi:AraC family transcriptional regulator [Enterovibrio sp. ZSDZ42]|uniref:AraC family transcriptional regulator n=1 Tax=Enterovibrio gelatinilyticus TaxID=2899819 RepID=A0ABT5R5E1_9GAMM|nr:AraC family transcriptional regulator [Enterovibrio sp. ZSDZ42]MDD1795501.1 AraC family transcriptional regulator [Enterovibrio sp. ZSDZ42]
MGAIDSKSVLDVSFNPQSGYPLPIEICHFSEIKQRGKKSHLRAVQRLDFYLLLGITQGNCLHNLDFVLHKCNPGDWLLVTPGQVLQFDLESEWDAWLVMFRPEVLLPKMANRVTFELSNMVQLDDVEQRMSLSSSEHATATDLVSQMEHDAKRGNKETLTLLQLQLQTLLIRLTNSRSASVPDLPASASALERVERFKLAVERHYKTSHQSKSYAKQLGYAEKTLSRATIEVLGISPKQYLSNRLILEAKRMLAHTADQISLIGDELGFDEITNFVKFFKRQTGLTPREFRQQYRVASK